jgi:hypothetical protein
MLKLMGQ